MYSYSLKVTENDEAVSFLIGSRQRRQKNYSKVCDELIGSHLKLVPFAQPLLFLLHGVIRPGLMSSGYRKGLIQTHGTSTWY